MLTDPELIGLMALRSRLPECVGGGKLKPGIAEGDAAGRLPGKPGGRPGDEGHAVSVDRPVAVSAKE